MLLLHTNTSDASYAKKSISIFYPLLLISLIIGTMCHVIAEVLVCGKKNLLYAGFTYSCLGTRMAFECPDCKEKTLSTRLVEVKVCLNCGKIIGSRNVLELLKKIGVQEKAINIVRNDLVAREL